MVNKKNIVLCISLLSAQYSYPSEDTHAYDPSPITVDSMTQESYILPEMQWTVLSLQKPSYMEINATTGMVENIPTVSNLLNTIQAQLFAPASITNEQKELYKSILHAMLEATEIATSTVSIKMAYQDPDFIYRNDLLASLSEQKAAIQAALHKVNAINQSYTSWIFGSSGPSKAQKLVTINSNKVSFNNNATTIMIPAELMPSIIQLNDFKQQSDATAAANLLFQQCFLAQQQHADNPIPLEIHNPFGAADYIYTALPRIYAKYSNTYPICDDILKLNFDERRSRLLQIRQAVQIALSIANKKSSVNTGFQYLTSFFDGIVSELMRYDAYVSTLCKNPNYGATAQDIAKSAEWSTMSKALAVGAVIGGTLIAIHAYDKNALPSAYNATAEKVNSGYNSISDLFKTKTTNTNPDSSLQASDVAKWSELPKEKQEEFIKSNQEKTKTHAAHIAKQNMQTKAINEQKAAEENAAAQKKAQDNAEKEARIKQEKIEAAIRKQQFDEESAIRRAKQESESVERHAQEASEKKLRDDAAKLISAITKQ